MAGLPEKGRRSENKSFEKDTHFRNTITPESAEMGMLKKQDEIIAAINGLTAAIDAAVALATDGNSLWAALAAAPVATALKKLKLM